MTDPELELTRDKLLNAATELYASGELDEAGFELIVTRLNSCDTVPALRTVGLSLPVPYFEPSLAPLSGSGTAEINCDFGNVRKTGDWVEAGLLLVSAKGSNIRLDFEAYEAVDNFRMEIELDCLGSNVRLIVPASFRVEDKIGQNVASNIKNKAPHHSYGSNHITVTGRLKGSNLKIKYLK